MWRAFLNILKVKELRNRLMFTALIIILVRVASNIPCPGVDPAALERFIKEFKGSPKLLAPLHLLAEHEHIRLQQNYAAAAEHLEAGSRIGYYNPGEQRSALFRLGFFYYKYLNEPQKAQTALENFLRLYPDSPDTPTAERFLKELRRKK